MKEKELTDYILGEHNNLLTAESLKSLMIFLWSSLDPNLSLPPLLMQLRPSAAFNIVPVLTQQFISLCLLCVLAKIFIIIINIIFACIVALLCFDPLCCCSFP